MKKKLFNYPKGLYTITFVEIWERFSFYGMRYCFVLYMVKELLFSQQKSSYIYGLYGSFAYFAPLFCGYFVDKYIGMRKAITIGSIFRFFGLLCLGSGEEKMLIPSLAMITIATGFLRAGMNPLVGIMYDKNDDIQRDAGFRFFYTAAHIGVLLGVMVCGYVGQKYGYRYAFISAGITIMIGQVGYFLTAKNTLGDLGKEPIYKTTDMTIKLTKQEKNNLFAMFIIYFIFINIYDICYEQQGNTITLFVENNVDRDVFGFNIPTPWFHIVNVLMVIIFTPISGLLWHKKELNGKGISYISKFSLGLFFIGLSYVVLMMAGYYTEKYHIISIFWIVAVSIIQTIGEIHTFPTGNSLIGALYSHIGKMYFFLIFVLLAFSASFILFLIRNKVNRLMK